MKGVLRRIARFVTGKLLPYTAYPILLGPLRGYRFVLGSLAGAGGGASVYFNQVEPEQSEAMLGILKPGDVFFDIGRMSPNDNPLVPVVTVDAVSALLSVQPNVLKIDVEGAELAVLQGAWATLNSARPCIFLSVHSDELRYSCTAFLNSLQYEVKALNRDTSRPTEFLAKPLLF